MFKHTPPVAVAILSLILAALACNAPPAGSPSPSLPTAPPAATSGPMSTPEQPRPTLTFSPSPSPPRPTDTPVPDVSGESGCTFNASYVADVTVPDDTEMSPGEAFHKVWRMRNSGTCDWKEGTELVFVSGEPPGTSEAVAVPVVAAGGTVDLGVDMVAPTAPGTYRSTWQLRNPEGVFFGSQVYAQIVVPERATATPTAEPPTATPTATPPTETPTEEPPPSPPDLVIGDIHLDTDPPRQGEPFHIIVTLLNQGGSPAENFHWAWRICDSCEYIEAPGTFTLGPGEETTAQIEYTFGGYAQYTTVAWVDSREEVAESDEGNNTRQLEFTVQRGTPDLVVSDMAFDPDPPVQDSAVAVRVTVLNQGTASADGPFTVEWWGGVGFAEPSCIWEFADRIAAGHSEVFECTFKYGSWYANITTRAIADVDNSVVESDEGNNSLEKTISVSRP